MYTVPIRVIFDPQASVGDSSISVTMTVVQPPPISRDLLNIVSTIDGPDTSRMLFSGYPPTSLQYAVNFKDLLTPSWHLYLCHQCGEE